MKKLKMPIVFLMIVVCISEGLCQFGAKNIYVDDNNCYMLKNVSIWPVSQENGRYLCGCAAMTVILQAAAGLQSKDTYFNLIEQVGGVDCEDTSNGHVLYNYQRPMQQQDCMDYILSECAKRDPVIQFKGIKLENFGEEYYDPKYLPKDRLNPENAYLPSIYDFRAEILDGKPVVFQLMNETTKKQMGHGVVFYGYEKPIFGTNWIMLLMDGNGIVNEMRYKELSDGRSQELFRALYFLKKVFTPVVGVEDNIGIASGPEHLSHPAGTCVYQSMFYDHPPASNALIWNWKIYFHHSDGAYVTDSRDSIYGLNQSSWTANVGSLPAWYNWERDSLGRVRGEVRVETIDSDNTYHYYIKNITYAAPPPPAEPVLTSPSNNATNLTSPFQFSWNSVSGAIAYQIEITVNQFINPDLSWSVRATSATDSSLSPGTQYYWRVGAIGDWGTTWSETHTFTTQSLSPGAPSKAPGATSTGIVIILCLLVITGCVVLMRRQNYSV